MQKILSLLRKACCEHNLIENGDKICVGVSGGKDSLTLLKALSLYQKFSTEKFELCAVAVDLSSGKCEYSEIENFCKEISVEFTKVDSDIFEIVFEIRKEKNPCSLCANMRRGILNNTAKSLGCNKVALGHHKDDFIETFLLSLFYEGRLSTFKPKSYLSRVDLTVIRPLLYCDEDDVKRVSSDLPILINPCPADKHTQRENTKDILKNLDQSFKGSKEKIFNALIHTERYNLLDKE